jgi:hypothetical protein
MVIRGRFPPEIIATLDRVVAETGLRIAAFTEAHAALAHAAFHRCGKGRHAAGLNVGDCMAYAVARAEGARLMFTGDDFAKTDVARWDVRGGSLTPTCCPPAGTLRERMWRRPGAAGESPTLLAIRLE